LALYYDIGENELPYLSLGGLNELNLSRNLGLVEEVSILLILLPIEVCE
jgi:hypothetical protein